jgi:low temperature requirement protein LtrA
LASPDAMETLAEKERHATNLELFLDLVFVFAVTQITTLLAGHASPHELLQVLLLAFMAWWQWTAFTWAGTASDLQGSTATRVLVLSLIGPTLLMAIAIPQAFQEGAIWFGTSYLLVMVMVTLMQGVEAFKREDTREAYLRYAPLALSMPVVVFVGSFFAEPIRMAIWFVAMAFSVAAALVQGEGAGGNWIIEPVHFAERLRCS